ncbi:MAG: hypothetical protein NWS06_03060 [Candidatus Nanopelagicales bacterium]|jgi:Flp pilus assembly protein TadG|nr:hypothetical protein [Candidatus Nanopelagicales bacterium]
MKFRSDNGNVIVEFIGVTVALLIPISIVASASLTIAQSYLATDVAARNGSRAFVISNNDATANNDARSAANLSMQDHKALDENVSVSTACSKNPCLTPGGFVTVTVSRQIDLNLPINLGSRSVLVSAQHTAIVDELRSP